MNILITNDDGPLAVGLLILQCAAKQAFPHGRIVTLTPQNGEGGKALSVTTSNKAHTVHGGESGPYVCDATPADLIYLALGSPSLFLDEGESFDLVLTGVNHGENVGMDVFHSGTVGMALLATGFFKVPAVAFSQQIPYPAVRHDETPFRTALEWLPQFLSHQSYDSGKCWSINFQASSTLGFKVCSLSMYSRFQPAVQPMNKAPGGDVYELEQGYVTGVPLRPAGISCEHAPQNTAINSTRLRTPLMEAAR